jgi:hypothetical protein
MPWVNGHGFAQAGCKPGCDGLQFWTRSGRKEGGSDGFPTSCFPEKSYVHLEGSPASNQISEQGRHGVHVSRSTEEREVVELLGRNELPPPPIDLAAPDSRRAKPNCLGEVEDGHLERTMVPGQEHVLWMHVRVREASLVKMGTHLQHSECKGQRLSRRPGLAAIPRSKNPARTMLQEEPVSPFGREVATDPGNTRMPPEHLEDFEFPGMTAAIRLRHHPLAHGIPGKAHCAPGAPRQDGIPLEGELPHLQRPFQDEWRRRPEKYLWLPPLVDHLEGTIGPFDARLPIVEGLDQGEAARISRLSRRADMHPANQIASAGKALVEDIQIHEPAAMEEIAISIDVRGAAVRLLDNGRTLAIVASVAPAPRVGGVSFQIEVAVEPLAVTDRASGSLVVAAPGIPLGIELLAILADVMPSLLGDDGSTPFVEAKGSAEASGIDRAPSGIDVPGLCATANRGQTWCVKREHLVETFGVERLSLESMVGAVGRKNSLSPIRHDASSGRRMLQRKQR